MKPPNVNGRWCRTGAVIASLLSAVALAGPDRGPDHRDFPSLKFSGSAHGAAAVSALGSRLPELANAYGFDAFALRRMFDADSTLGIDDTGRLHYTEPAFAAAGAVQAAPQIQALVPLVDTFKLHSRPSAKRIIYLDFDGHVMSGNGWTAAYNAGNPITAPAWSIDADPAFNDAERTTIQYIWQRVAEDYAPFDVDVTTELTSEDQITRTDLNDQFYGTRALISPISSYIGYYGGIAYVGVFDSVGDYYKPALVFPENLGPNGESYIAEAISHEVGHNFNLNHDGTSTTGYYSGQGNWAPIMGVGYYVTLVQWSKGEYTDANQKQDDLAIIAGYVGYRPDDHGNTSATATQLPAGTSLSASGVITSSTDVDVFAFVTGAGNVVINLNPDDRSANLDISAELRNSAGTLVAASNPLGALNASFSLNLAAGTYFVHVRGTGEGSPTATGYSSYASLGQYKLTGTVLPSGPQPPVSAPTASLSLVAPGQAITFSGSGSFDPDGGSIVTYSWAFSDVTTASGVSVSKSFANPGTYTATLTVTDDEGATNAKAISVVVNRPPVAAIAVTPGTSGFAPFAVNFSGAGSTDTDGSIASYAWTFGDGTTGTGVSVAKTYSNIGTYTATLTVKDNNGASGTKTASIAVTQNPASVLRVQSIALLVQTSNRDKTVRSTVKVTNPSGGAISGVTVRGTWSGLVSGTVSGTTDSTGTVVFTSSRTRSTGNETFAITGLSRTGYVYDSTKNVVTSATIAVP